VPRYLKWLDGVFYAISLVPFLAELRRTFPFDLIDAHFAYPDGMAAVLLGGIFRCPVAITLRGSIVRLATYPLHRPQLRFALSQARRVLSVSQSLKQVAVGLGIPEEKIRVIPNGVDAEQFSPRDQGEARRALGLPVSATIVVSVGWINEGKGHHRIAKMLPEIRQRHPNFLYVIVGAERPGDTYRPQLEQLIERLDLRANVMIAGERPHDEIPQWLAAANLLCLATRSEGWANVLLEALGCGTPVVTTRVGGNAEIITSDALGILVEPHDDKALADAIVEALRREWDPSVMVAHARAHSWESTAMRVTEEWRQLASPARHRDEHLSATRQRALDTHRKAS
jgi:glycosyltransferase involved in cell wall biosynthesis